MNVLTKAQLRTDLPEIRPGYTVRVYQKVKEAPKASKRPTGQGDKERLQSFEGLVIAKKHGKGINATFTVRKIFEGIGVERIFPLHSPTIEKIEVLKKAKVRRAKLYYMRKRFGKSARLKQKLEVPVSGPTSAEFAESEEIAESEPVAEGKTEKPTEEKQSKTEK